MKKSNDFPANLYMVATPIGNLADLSPRAMALIAEAQQIICESPRHSRVILDRCMAKPECIVKLTEHSTATEIERLVQRAQSELSIYISDAGMPTISDPGSRLVAAAHAKGLSVGVLPGPSAVLSALALSGYSETRFQFHGFLPHKLSAREAVLQDLTPGLHVFFDSPQRIAQSLSLVAALWGEEQSVFVVKEMTKLYERYWRGSVQSILAQWDGQSLKGEFVWILPLPKQDAQDQDSAKLEAWIRALRAEGVSLRSAVSILSKTTGQKKNALYKRVSSYYNQDEVE